MVLDSGGDEQQPVQQRWLYRCDDRSPFAFARGDVFVRYADHLVWARLDDDRLLSARSGECLAYQVGSVFYGAMSHEPLYYETPIARPLFGQAAPAARPRDEPGPDQAARSSLVDD